MIGEARRVNIIRLTTARLPAIHWEVVFLKAKKFLGRQLALKSASFIFTTPGHMAAINKKYRRRGQPTNILTFAGGDIFLCPSLIRLEAKNYGLTYRKWMTRLLVHGILHLAGYDHKSSRAGSRMEKIEKVILARLGIVS